MHPSAVSCMDVAHIRWKYDIDTGAVMKKEVSENLSCSLIS